jgi:hypothetical protein
MADVPDEAVAGCVEYIVKRDGQLDDAQSRTEMAAGLGDGVNGFGPQFVGKLLKLIGRQVFEVVRKKDAVEQRGLGRIGQEQLQHT